MGVGIFPWGTKWSGIRDLHSVFFFNLDWIIQDLFDCEKQEKKLINLNKFIYLNFDVDDNNLLWKFTYSIWELIGNFHYKTPLLENSITISPKYCKCLPDFKEYFIIQT